MKNFRKSVMFSAILTIIMCLSLLAGATFALFTSEAKVNIAVTSGKVNIEATISNFEAYTPKSVAADGTIIDKENIANNDDEAKVFGNGGTAVLDGGTIELSKMVPGDKVSFKLTIKNFSNVTSQYRLSVAQDTSSDEAFFNALDIKIGELSVKGNTLWKNLEAASFDDGDLIAEYDCVVELPAFVSGSEYQDKACKLLISVEAVQGNAAVVNDENVVVNAVVAQKITSDKVDENNKITEEIVLKASENVAVGTTTVAAAKASLPAKTKLVAGATEVSLKVTETANASTFSVAEDNDAKSFEISMDGVASDNEEKIEIQLYVGTGLLNPVMYHNGKAMDAADYSYDTATGVMTIKTATFSPFTVEYTPIAKIGNVGYTSFAKAVESAKKGDTIKLIVDTEVASTDYNVDKRLSVKANNVTIDLNGKTLTISNHTFTILGENVIVKNGKMVATATNAKQTNGSYAIAVSGKNATIDGVTTLGGISVTGYDVDDSVFEGVSATIVNCNITATNYYTVCSQGAASAVIKNSTLIAEKGVAFFWIEKGFTDELGTVADSSLSYESTTVTMTGSKPVYNTGGLTPAVIE